MDTNYINNLDFAERHQILEGEVSLDQLARLSELLAMDGVSSQSAIVYKLLGQSKKYQQPSLHLQVDAFLPVYCQRCLEDMHVPLHLNFEYVISAEMPESMDDTDDLDWLEPSEHMDLLVLIEDELLAALPIAPVHAMQCKQLKLESGERANPFAMLKQLKKE